MVEVFSYNLEFIPIWMRCVILAIIPFWIFTTAWIDAGHYNKQQWVISHMSRNFNRGVVILFISAISPIFGIYTLFAFWGLFDGMLSLQRKLKWNYIGSVTMTDRFFKDKSDWFRFSKHLSLGVCFILVFNIICYHK